MFLSEKQQGVLKGIIIGAVVTVVVIFGSIFLGPELLAHDTPMSGRLAFALKVDLFIALWLGLSVGRLARQRFF